MPVGYVRKELLGERSIVVLEILPCRLIHCMLFRFLNLVGVGHHASFYCFKCNARVGEMRNLARTSQLVIFS
jgi:hypothetical protein